MNGKELVQHVLVYTRLYCGRACNGNVESPVDTANRTSERMTKRVVRGCGGGDDGGHLNHTRFRNGKDYCKPMINTVEGRASEKIMKGR